VRNDSDAVGAGKFGAVALAVVAPDDGANDDEADANDVDPTAVYDVAGGEYWNGGDALKRPTDQRLNETAVVNVDGINDDDDDDGGDGDGIVHGGDIGDVLL
jgi:hypothetical protein